MVAVAVSRTTTRQAWSKAGSEAVAILSSSLAIVVHVRELDSIVAVTVQRSMMLLSRIAGTGCHTGWTRSEARQRPAQRQGSLQEFLLGSRVLCERAVTCSAASALGAAGHRKAAATVAARAWQWDVQEPCEDVAGLAAAVLALSSCLEKAVNVRLAWRPSCRHCRRSCAAPRAVVQTASCRERHL